MINIKIHLKFLFLSVIIGVCALVVSFTNVPHAHALGNPPMLGLPYASGTSGVSMGTSGLHAGNFYAVPGTPYILNGSSSVTDASLDIGFVGQSSTSVNAISLATLGTGTVLIGYGNSCNMVLIDYGDIGNGTHLWGEYIHMSQIPTNLTAGATVYPGQAVGTPTTNYVCNESGTPNFVHTHFAFLYGSGTSGTYQSQVQTLTTLCGHNVINNPINPPDNIHTENNLQGLTSPFTIPNCPTNPPLTVTSGISVTAPTSHPVIMGESMTATYTVTNSTSSPFYIDQLFLSADDGNGHSFDIGGDWNGSSFSVGPNGGTWQLNVTQSQFASNCSSCTYGGTYHLQAKYQTTSGGWVNLTSSGSGNSYSTINVGKPAIPQISTALTITSPQPVPLGGNLSASFTVYNTGDENLNLDQLALLAQDPSNDPIFLVVGDGNSAVIPAHGTRAFSKSVNNFFGSSNCPNCILGGTYNFYASYQDTGSNYHTIGVGAGSNPIQATVNVGKPAAIQYANGVVSLFARGASDNQLYQNYKSSADGSWSGWGHLTAQAEQFSGDPVVAQNQDGRLEVFIKGTDGNMWHIAQKLSSDGGGWTNWGIVRTGSFIGNPTTAKDSNGNLELFVRESNNQIYQAYQATPGGGYNGSTNDPGSNWGGWNTMGSTTMAGDPFVLADQTNARFNLYARGTDNNLYQDYSKFANEGGGWSGWGTVNTAHQIIGDPVVIQNPDNREQVFAQGTDSNVWYIAQKLSSDGGGWTNWANLSGTIIGKPSISMWNGGGLELYVRGSGDYKVYHAYETQVGGCYNGGNNDPGTCWSGYGFVQTTNNYSMISDITNVINSDGREEVIGIGTDQNMYDAYQKTQAQGGGWNGWNSLGSSWE